MASLASSSSSAGLTRAPTMLEQLLEEINFQRTKELRQMLKDDSGFVVLQGTTYWTDLFVRHFLFQAEHTIDGDDLLFFVRKKHVKTSSRYLPKFETEVDVFRKDSKKLPIGDPDIDWEETVYLNLVVHQFDYTLTLAICTRTSPKELQVLRRHSQKVYASPSRRRMDAKGDLEEMTYPHICFMVDNFDEVFCDILVRDGEMVCVELVASDREGAIQGVIFLGSIRYDALKKVYDARVSRRLRSMQIINIIDLRKGHAEMAVTKPKGSGAETPTSEPGYCATDALWDADWDDAEELFMYRHQRRLSDPSSNLNNFVRGGWRTKPDTAATKARSENEGLDSMANGLNEIEAGDPMYRIAAGAAGAHLEIVGVPARSVDEDHRIRPGNTPSRTSNNYVTPPGNDQERMRTRRFARRRSIARHTKLDSGAILVHGKEELPLGYDVPATVMATEDNTNRKRRPYSAGHLLNHHHNGLENDEEERRRLSDDELLRVRRADGRRRLRSAGSDHEDYTNGSNKYDEIRDKNANAREVTNGVDAASTRRQCATLPRRRRRRAFSSSFAGNPLPPHRVTPDGTAIYYWCELPRRPGSQELDDGAYNPLWTMRGFTQTFHFWKETKRAQSVPLNAFLTYITLPWWSIAKDILDHREGPILTF
ncbi:hypothetical protein DMN91_012060 [Ooceraea biroi]|uniref:Uncharacterized protein n=1 Tax=Ooceraea biroi TaxID=2015173 RepID=A0A3L8D772_OOCBI|nr:hypothetical protein DMN91_012060 [Ooceraea biroi]